MDSNPYKFIYEGEDRYLSYFAKNPLEKWQYEDFEAFFSLNKKRKQKKDTLEASYAFSLILIKTTKNPPKEIKNYINALLERLEEKENSKQPTIQYNFGDGNNNLYNDKVIYNNNNASTTASPKESQSQSQSNTPSPQLQSSSSFPYSPQQQKQQQQPHSEQQHQQQNFTTVSSNEPSTSTRKRIKLNSNEFVIVEDQSSEEEEEYDDDDSETICIKSDIWGEWKHFISEVKQDGNIYKYSPLNYNIIRFGYGLKPMNEVPYDLYYNTINTLSDDISNVNKSSHYSNGIILENQDYINSVLDSESLESMKNSIKNENENQNNLLENLFTAVANIYGSHNPPITHSESCYSFFFVWPCLIALVDSINDIRTDSLYFYPGEEKLRCMLSQLKRIDPFIDSRHGYNADAILRCRHYDDLECLILEVSSSYGRVDKIKHAQDHIKGTFGLLAMLKGVADRYEHGTIDTFKKLKVFFLQSYNECFYLWSLSYVGNDLYSLFRECKAKVPFDFHRKDETLLDFIILHHHLECLLMDLFDTLEKLKKEHTTNLRNRRYQSSDSYTTLKDIIRPTIVKVSCLKNNYKGIGDEEPTSSPVPF